MGRSFFVGEIQEQASEAIRLADAYIEHASTLKDSIYSFLSAPLSGKAYDSAKKYFEAVYEPISNALILAAESMREAHTNFLEKFLEIVGEGDIEEDRLLDQIQKGQNLLRAYAEVLDKLGGANQLLEQGYMCTQEAIRKLEERLESLYLFDSISSVIFSEAEDNLAHLERGLAFLSEDESWNSSSGAFDIMKLDLTWTRPVDEAWVKRQKRVAAHAVADCLSKRHVDYSVEVTTDESSNASYFVYKNGKLNSKLTLELARLMAEFRLAEQNQLTASFVGDVQPCITDEPFRLNDEVFTINRLMKLGNSLAIGCGMNTETDEPAQVLVRTKDAKISELLTTASVEISELLTGKTLDEK